jgi:hypothetical protein
MEASPKEYVLSWKINDGEEQTVQSPSGKHFVMIGEMSTNPSFDVSETGFILAELCDDGKTGSDSYLIIDTNSGSSYVVEKDDAYGSEENKLLGEGNHIIMLSDECESFYTTDNDLVLRRYSINESKITGKVDLSSFIEDPSDVSDVMIFDHEKKAAIWTNTMRLYIFDLNSGDMLAETTFNNMFRLPYSEIRMVEDPERNRVFFTFSEGNTICIDTATNKKVADFNGFSEFCPETNEIYLINSNVLSFKENTSILKVKGYTLNDLIDKAELKK